ncbi:MAG: Gfo/Idh/MocA family oxidoreductase [Planctomycetes bacterium]|nr:Gfo/Idh/MocA family oxidoreductase [Planctomycetota bacterium]
MARQRTRRSFMKESGLAGVGFWVAAGLQAQQSKSPNERVQVACIGVGGKGSSDTDQAGQVAEIVALCDIDENYLNKKAEKFPDAKKYYDFRQMLDEMGKSIDAVTVSTPDHTHAPASMMAMKLGKHVYCQKPLTHTVHEARLMRETAAKMNVVTQMGNQGTAANGLRRAAEILRAGVLGDVKEVHVWTNRPVWPQSSDAILMTKAGRAAALSALHGKALAELPATPVPSHVHWDLFLGPAPERPYEERVYHPFNWRGWWDYGTGALGDMACHTANMAFNALKLTAPSSIDAKSAEVNPETFPSWAVIHFQFPGIEGRGPIKFVWYEGQERARKKLPPDSLLQGEKPSDSGSLIIGEKGTLYSPNDYGAEYKFLGPHAKEIVAACEQVPETIPRNGKGDLGMKEEWIAGIKGGPAPMSNFQYASTLTESILLGNVAIKAGRKVEYDGATGKVTNDPSLNALLTKEYRSGWTL